MTFKTVPAALRATLAALLAALVLAACGSKVSQENFDRIKSGMTKEEVVAILGKPDETSGFSLGNLSGESAAWTGRDASISVQFANDKVLSKQYSKAAAK
ncbi:MAG: DUF3862 domain-containing protein [Pseudomonadota bacterium]